MAARAAIGHPNLLRAWAVGEAESRLFVAFERCQHPSLTELLATAPLEPSDCARVLDGAASGVDALTRQGLVAGNLTPERVLVDPRHGGILMDLGIPPELMRPLPLERDPDLAFRSPEELRGQPVDVRSSVYSLGVVLFTALTGDPPYSGAPVEIYSRHLEGAPPRPSERRPALSPEFDAVVARAMAADPAERYPDAGALCRAAKAAAGLAPVPVGPKPNEGPPKPARKPVPAPPKPAPVEVRQVPQPAKGPPTPQLPDPRPASEPAHRCGRVASARRTAAPAAADPTADAKRRGMVPARRRARAAKTRWAPRRNPPVTSLATFITDAANRRTPAWPRRPAALASTSAVAISATQPRTPAANSKLVLAAVVAIVVSGLSGIALGRALKPGGDRSSITRSGLTVKLPAGWEPARINPGRPALSSAIAAVPSGETKAGLVAGKLSSQAAAERMFEEVQQAGGARTQVRLGALVGWRYAGLRPRRKLVGIGFLVPTTDGAVVMLCHASKDEAWVRLAECAHAATTMVVSGERLPNLTSVDPSRKRLVRVIAELRSSRSEGRERLAAADLAHRQIRAATSLKVSHQRAARSVEEISFLENGHSLEGMASALRATAAAYGRLAGAAAAGSFSAYQEASRFVGREEEALRRELARVSAP